PISPERAGSTIRGHFLIGILYVPGGLSWSPQVAVAQGNDQAGVVHHEVVAALFQNFPCATGVIQGLFGTSMLQVMIGGHAQAQGEDIVVPALPDKLCIIISAYKPVVVLEQLQRELKKPHQDSVMIR